MPTSGTPRPEDGRRSEGAPAGVPRPVSEHTLRRRVQFYETDMAGVVHFSWFFRFMEEAEHALWRSAGLSVAAPGAAVGWPRVAASFEYRRPLRFEDEFEVRIRVAARGAKTMRFVCVVTRAGDDIGAGSMTVACVTHLPGEPMRAVEIPGDIAARFEVAADVT
jgi:acyl-CoA thioester hydrolase